ncbi:hypothetical protein MYX04_12425 [Nitrospiraceae bacterium AH_259_D15_M11_P09]|nr:hypothetical protein [Nitrospiraceae bacterium AH_259_D15_M11_P09]
MITEVSRPESQWRTSASGPRIYAEYASAQIESPQMIDEFPILCVAAAVAEGETFITGAEELRVKESDRITVMASELRKMGAVITETPDGLRIQGLGGKRQHRLRGARCDSYGDHRVAMSLAIAAVLADGPTRIDDVACIETSFPCFEDKLSKLLTKS